MICPPEEKELLIEEDMKMQFGWVQHFIIQHRTKQIVITKKDTTTTRVKSLF